MRIWNRLAVVITLLAAGLVGAQGAALATPTPADTGKAGKTQYCNIVVGKAPKGELSPILSRSCGTDPEAARTDVSIQARTLLMEWNEHAFNDPPTTVGRIYGDYGPCDSDGYRVRAEGFWANRISGFVTWNRCSVATGYDLVNVSGDQQTWNGTANACECVDVGFVGYYMNDRIESFWIRRG
ncbi:MULTISPECIES: hypothetical protein [unclassified Nonomuraea]|uniref:hypothetical protein n=1 Tax=Nonomuraea sp. NPDC049725 TaxID=3154508 RepID=UPI00342BAC61